MMSFQNKASTFFHRYLNIPHTLHIEEFQSPKKPKATYIFLHGIGNTLYSWNGVVKNLPKDVRIIGVDLLGFGESPKPTWAVYSAKTQARSVGLTIIGLRLTQQPVIIGHSLGALVAVELAKRYPLMAKRLILCSPPFYKPEAEKGFKQADDRLRQLYRIAKRNPERLVKFSPIAVKLGLANKALSITQDNVGSYVEALESSIINQNSLQTIQKLKVPIDIFYGALDTVVIGKHIKTLASTQPNITAKRLLMGHEVVGGYAVSVAKYITSLTKPLVKK